MFQSQGLSFEPCLSCYMQMLSVLVSLKCCWLAKSCAIPVNVAKFYQLSFAKIWLHSGKCHVKFTSCLLQRSGSILANVMSSLPVVFCKDQAPFWQMSCQVYRLSFARSLLHSGKRCVQILSLAKSLLSSVLENVMSRLYKLSSA